MGFFDHFRPPPDVDALRRQKDAEGLTRALTYANDEQIRKKAAHALGAIGDKRHVEALIAALRDTADCVREAAAEALGKIGDPRAVEPLTAALKDPNNGVRDKVAESLDTFGWTPATNEESVWYRIVKREWRKCASFDTLAVGPLLSVLTDPDEQIRSGAAQALGMIRDTRAVQPLIAALTDESIPVRQAAAISLGKIGNDVAIEPLRSAVTRESPVAGCAAAEAIGHIGGAAAIRPLVESLTDKRTEIREAALEALDKLGWRPENDKERILYWIARSEWRACAAIGAPAVEPLITILEDPSANTRAGAIEVLGEIKDLRAVQPLIAALADDNDHVRQTAAEALGRIGDIRAVNPLIASLGDKSRDVRGNAVQALGRIGDLRAVEPLTDVLMDTDSEVHQCAATLLGRIGVPAVKSLLTALFADDSHKRKAAAEVLGEIGDPLATNSLIAALSDRDDDVRTAAAGALGKIRDLRSVNPLIAALKDEQMHQSVIEALANIGAPAADSLASALGDGSPLVCSGAAEALGRIGGAGPIELLTSTLRDRRKEVREAALAALHELRWKPQQDEDKVWYRFARREWDECFDLGESAVGPLMTVLHDPDENVRLNVIRVLGKIGDSRAADPLHAALQDKDNDIREAAAEALGNIGHPRSVRFLITAISDENVYVRNAAVEALGTIGDAVAVNPLITALNEDKVRKSAIISLGRIGSPAVESLIAVLRNREGCNDDGILGVIEVLGLIRDRRAVDPLIVALRDETPGVRIAAAEALGNLGDLSTIEPLTAALQNPRREVREAALGALNKLGWKPENTDNTVWYWIANADWENCAAAGVPAIGPLIHVLKDEDPYTRAGAALSLGNIRDTRAVMPLLVALKDEDKDTRKAAVEALGKIGDSRAVDALHTALQDNDDDIRKAAVEALGKIGDSRSVGPLLSVLRDADEDFEPVVIEALEYTVDERAVMPLISSLYFSKSRPFAVTALGNIGSAAVEPLLVLVKKTDLYSDFYYMNYEDREALKGAVQALGKTGDIRVVNPLIELFNKQNDEVNQCILRIVPEISYQALSTGLRNEAHGIRKGAQEIFKRSGRKPETAEDNVWFQIAGSDWDACATLGSDAVGPLIHALKDSDPSIRRGAAEALGKMGDPKALGPLLDAFSDSNEYVQKASAEALGRIGDTHAVDILISSLKTRVPGVQIIVMEALGRIGDLRAVEPLTAALKDPQKEVRKAASDSLDLMRWRPGNDENGAWYWIAKDYRLHQQTIDTLAKIGSPAVKPLISAFNDYQMRQQAIDALAKIGAPAVTDLLNALMEPSQHISAAAAETLGRIGDTRAIEPLLASLKKYEVRKVAAESLDKIGWTPDKDEISAWYWIAKQDPQRCVPIGIPAVGPLISVLNQFPLHSSRSDANHMHRSIIETLVSIRTPSVLPLKIFLDEGKGSCDEAVAGAAEALGLIGNNSAVDSLIVAFKKPSPDIRAAVVIALGRIGGTSVVGTLVAALRDHDYYVRKYAAGSLDTIGWKPAMDENGAWYWIANRKPLHCISIGAPAVGPLIATMKEHGEAMLALGEIGDTRALDPLINALSHKELGVRYNAAKALVTMYRNKSLDSLSKNRILKQRDIMARPHTDQVDSSDCHHHTDNIGIGILL